MKCLIYDEIHPGIFPELQALGIEVDYKPNGSRNELLAIIHQYEGLIIRSSTLVDGLLINAATNLKFVARAGAGIELIDVDLLNQKGITLINAPEGNRDALAEHTMGLLLGLLHRIIKSNKEVKDHKWEREENRGLELKGKTVGLIGYGYMGSAVAVKLKSFGCRVIAYDKYKKRFGNEFCQDVAMDEIYDQTDILSLHIPHTNETNRLVDKNYLEKFKKDIALINTARGGILDLEGILYHLESGKLIGVALDVLENENVKSWNKEETALFNTIAARDNVIITPHIGGWTHESYIRINKVLVNKIKAAFF